MQIGARTAGGLVGIRVTTGGAGYTAAPTFAITGGGGAGATGVVVMAGTVVDSVIVTAAGTGFTGTPTVSFSGGGGTGAAAQAYAYTAPFRPMSFFKGRFGDLYGVDGMGRGVRWDGGTQMKPIGLHKPAAGPVIAASSTAPPRVVSSIDILNPGSGYSSTPTVVISGGTPSKAAEARATVASGRVVSIRVTEPGAGYAGVPTISLTGGIGTGGTFTVGVLGKVVGFDVNDRGSGYEFGGDGQPTITVNQSNGLTGFQGRAAIDTAGRLIDVNVLAAGTGATTTPSFTIQATTGSGAAVTPRMLYTVNAITIANSGSGFASAPVITFQPDVAYDDTRGTGALNDQAAATCAIDNGGHITAVTLLAGGQYGVPPTAFVADSSARAQVTMASPASGSYLCCYRYIDDTGKEFGGPIPSSISHLVKVSTGPAGAMLEWSFTHPYLDDRVTAMELWRTTADQEVLLFRVATIQRSAAEFTGTYTESLTDADLADASRVGYGLMPITLPSGQINARRFEVPPATLAVGVMFQDRAWYAVDTSGRRANSLFYSEIDEPESVPAANELVVQENTGTPDAIVALVPLGPSLLVVQSAHIYRLMYVAQPVIDASIMLAAYRGALNSRCWAVMAGVAFLADSVGLYAFDGNQEQSVSTPVDNYWRDGIIDFSKSDKFHLAADFLTKTIRFYYCRAADSEPVRSLCYSVATQAWWEEVYPQAVTAATVARLGGQVRTVTAHADGAWRKPSGTKDGSDPVAYAIRTGNFQLSAEPDRAIEVVYGPTDADSVLSLGLHYNNSATARPNAIAADRGSGVAVSPGGPALLNMNKARSPLGEATGYANALFAGRRNDRSAGSDQHVAVHLAGSQTDDPVVIHALRVQGAEGAQ
jgi:hypothetical protein